MSLHSLKPLPARTRQVLRSARGAFDLPSIIVGVVVVGILAAGVLAAVFGVIPFAQENGAKQDLSAIRTAEGVAKAKDGRFMDAAGLKAAGYISSSVLSAAADEGEAGGFSRVADVSTSKPLSVQADALGTCYVSVVRAPTGKIFAGTSVRPDAFPVESAADITECLGAPAVEAMFASLSPSAAPTAVGAGYVSTWGLNTHSVLGDGSTADRSRVPVSVSAIAGNTVTQMASGSYFNCAVAGGAVYCWGDNTSGQLGNNSLVDSPLPVPVDTSGVLAGKTITAVAAGGQLACALADGAAYCWGHNMYGGLGNKTTVDSSVPVAVDMTGVLAGKRITSIAVSHQFACAVADGAGYCWGSNWVGELGNGASAVVANPSPTAVVMTGALAGKTINAIDLGSSHACALASGAVYCWGTGMHGALGTGDFTAAKVPVAVRTNGVLAGKTVTAISAGYDTGCAVADGAAYCWGYNNYGQLGIGYTGDTPNPSVVIASNALAGKTVTAINSGSWHTCAIADGAAYCWGQGQGGQLGDGDLAGADKTEPVAVKTDGVLSGKTITAIDTGYYHTAALYK